VGVRQAIRIGVDPQAFIDSLAFGKGGYNVAGIAAMYKGWSLPEEEVRRFYPRDIPRAKKLLTEAGYPTGPKVTITVHGDSLLKVNESLLLQSQLKAIGFDVELKILPTAAHVDARLKGEFEIMTYPRTIRGDPGLNLYAIAHSKGSQNWSRISDPHLDRLLEKQRLIVDLEERKKIVHEALRYINENALEINIYYSQDWVYWQPWVKGYYPHLYWGLGLKLMDTWLDK